jgi:hypothetical protein
MPTHRERTVMANLGRKLALLAGAAEAARRYAHKNPDKAGRIVDQAAQFVDKQTKGRYRGQIDGFARKAKGAAGIPTTPGYGAAGHPYSRPDAHPGPSDYRTPRPDGPTAPGAPS